MKSISKNKFEFDTQWKQGVYEAIIRRRDIRSFRPDLIEDEVLAKILAAANMAGSVGFMQPWNFILIRDQQLRSKIKQHVDLERIRAAQKFEGKRRKKYLSLKLEGILDAPVNICVTCDTQRNGPNVLGRHTIPQTDVYSTCLAIQNLWLAARAEGIGVGWVSIYDPKQLCKILNIPQHVIPVAYLCVGYTDDFPSRPMLETIKWLPKNKLSEIVYSDQWKKNVSEDLEQYLNNQQEA